jgi:hypothetical protein
MSATVRLSDIVDALEMQFDESSSFVDRDTGRVESVSPVLLRAAEESRDDEDPDLADWQKQEWEVAKLVVSTDRFQKLPTKFEIHEWAIMQDFSHSVKSDRIREDLLHAIHGNGAFRNFKDALRRHRIESAWFAFRGGSFARDRTGLVQRESRGMGVGIGPVDAESQLSYLPTIRPKRAAEIHQILRWRRGDHEHCRARLAHAISVLPHKIRMEAKRRALDESGTGSGRRVRRTMELARRS